MDAIRAVLTGDLVGSTDADPRDVDRAMAVLAETAAWIAGWRVTENIPVGDTRFTRHRGDGWQVLINAARFGLRAALLFQARLAARPDLPATRIAVGLAHMAPTLGADLSDAHGAAFVVSGRALGDMARGERLRLAGHDISPLSAAFIGLLDDRITDWTPEQAEAVAHAIVPGAPTQAAIAGTLGISPQALSARLSGARWPAIRRVLEAWEQPRPPGRAA